jgi:hypothetical protein
MSRRTLLDKLTERIEFMVSPMDLTRLDRECEQASLTRAEFCRRRVFGYSIAARPSLPLLAAVLALLQGVERRIVIDAELEHSFAQRYTPAEQTIEEAPRLDPDAALLPARLSPRSDRAASWTRHTPPKTSTARTPRSSGPTRRSMPRRSRLRSGISAPATCASARFRTLASSKPTRTSYG